MRKPGRFDEVPAILLLHGAVQSVMDALVSIGAEQYHQAHIDIRGACRKLGDALAELEAGQKGDAERPDSESK